MSCDTQTLRLMGRLVDVLEEKGGGWFGPEQPKKKEMTSAEVAAFQPAYTKERKRLISEGKSEGDIQFAMRQWLSKRGLPTRIYGTW